MVREDTTKAQRWAIADRLAEERLPAVNSLHKPAHPRTDTFYVKYGKRCFDILISGLALAITLPINLIIGIVTFFDVGSPLFFMQERLGKNGKTFQIIKFRNMRNTVDENGELLPAKDRVTRFGRFVRRTSLDELLNFWSVFKGDMSIIGPRPLVPEYYHRWSDRHVMRLALRPGLECPPRRLGDHIRTWQEQLENDIWYVENVSFKTDIMMIINLFRIAVNRKDTASRAGGASSKGIFMGYDLDGVAINLNQVPQQYLDGVRDKTTDNKESVLI